MKQTLNRFLLPVLLVFFQLYANAQQYRPAELQVGDQAPPLSIMKWAKGKPVPAFEKGQTYFVEFSSLYCPPCFSVMPHLHQLTEKYAGKLTVISIYDVFADAGPADYQDAFNDFLEKNNDTLNYTVALEKPGNATGTKWLRGQSAPISFIVNGDGRIAWSGHPASLADSTVDALLRKRDANLAPQGTAFTQTIEGHPVALYYIKNKKGDFQAAITNYGARLVYLQVPDKSGLPVSVVAGFDSLSEYVNAREPYYSATIGRVVNRLSSAKLVLDGKESTLGNNYGPCLFNGGVVGLHKQVWNAKQVNDHTVEFSLLSPDGEGGFPGNLNVKVTYSITAEETLKISYDATTDKPTIVNLSNQFFFNLNGESNGSIVNHLLTINADQYTPLKEHKFPVGTLAPVEGTPFDFRKPMSVGERIAEKNDQLKLSDGYDHNFVLLPKPKGAKGLTPGLTITGDRTGITMQVNTTDPCIWFYSGNALWGAHILRTGYADQKRTAFTVQPQQYPDAPNLPAFPSIELRPGGKYHSESEFSFSHN